MLMVLPEQSTSDLWAVGMHWNYTVDYLPSSDNHNITMTAIGKETITDAFGLERDSFIVRMSGEHYEDEEKSYRWVDAKNLLYLKNILGSRSRYIFLFSRRLPRLEFYR